MGGLAQNVQKTPPGKNVQKSQGQISQGQISQGQMEKNRFKPEKPEKPEKLEKCAKIPRSNISGMPRSNAKVKYFRNVWNVRNVKTENSQKFVEDNF